MLYCHYLCTFVEYTLMCSGSYYLTLGTQLPKNAPKKYQAEVDKERHPKIITRWLCFYKVMEKSVSVYV